ncbi:MAG: NUDIX domain-containing protein [bacterium]
MKRIRATAVVCHDAKIVLIHRIKGDQQYYTLPGGSIEPEDASVGIAAVRELQEETSLVTKLGKHIFSYTYKDVLNELFLCEYQGGQLYLPEDSLEAELTTETNQFNPVWIPVAEIGNTNIYPEPVKVFLKEYFG